MFGNKYLCVKCNIKQYEGPKEEKKKLKEKHM